MNLNYVKNVWRCNYCGEQGGMLSLYARLNHISNSEANREIREALRIENTVHSSRRVLNFTESTGDSGSGLPEPAAVPENSMGQAGMALEEIPQSPRARHTGNSSDSFYAFWNVDVEDAAPIAPALCEARAVR